MTEGRNKITLVSYHNTRPFLYGLRQHKISAQLDIQLDIPSEGARKLRAGEVHLGLVPVAVLNDLPDAVVFSDWCIGCDGPVKTVCLYGDVPIDEMENIVLDYHSLTSVSLCRLLVKKYWNCNPTFIPGRPGFRNELTGRTGGLVIGDRAIGMEEKFRFCYDLGEAWKNWTGLPFVFATWVITKPYPEAWLEQMNEAFSFGVKNIDVVAAIIKKQQMETGSLPLNFDIAEYLSQNISYRFESAQKESLSRFLDLIGHRKAVLSE